MGGAVVPKQLAHDHTVYVRPDLRPAPHPHFWIPGLRLFFLHSVIPGSVMFTFDLQ